MPTRAMRLSVVMLLATTALLALQSCPTVHAAPPNEAANEVQKLEKLERWLDVYGLKFNKIKPKYFDAGYRGVVCTEDVFPGDIVLEAPHSITLSKESALSSYIGEPLTDLDAQGMSTEEILMIHLLFERFRSKDHPAGESPYKDYIDALPLTYNSHPLFYEQADLAYLEGPAIFLLENQYFGMERVLGFLDHVTTVAPEVFNPAHFTETAVKWAYLTVKSRGWMATANSGYIIPGADMFNYVPGKGSRLAISEANKHLLDADEIEAAAAAGGGSGDGAASGVDLGAPTVLTDGAGTTAEEDASVNALLEGEGRSKRNAARKLADGTTVAPGGGSGTSGSGSAAKVQKPLPTLAERRKFCHVEAAVACRAGEEFYIDYGDKTNAELLVNYGFLLDDLSWTKINWVIANANAKAREDVQELVRSMGCLYQPFKVTVGEPLSEEFHACAAFLGSAVSEVSKLNKKGVVPELTKAAVKKHLRASSQHAGLKAVKETLDGAVALYKHSLEEDEAALAAHDAGTTVLSPNAAAALRLTVSERRVFKHVSSELDPVVREAGKRAKKSKARGS